VATLQVGVALLVAPGGQEAQQEAHQEGGEGGAQAGQSEGLLRKGVLPGRLVRSCTNTLIKFIRLFLLAVRALLHSRQQTVLFPGPWPVAEKKKKRKRAEKKNKTSEIKRKKEARHKEKGRKK
jgi:hypothetical protein